MNAAPEAPSAVETSPEWSTAAERVVRYLRAHGLVNPAQIARLTTDIIAIAHARSRPDADPLAVAMETLDSCLHAWFSQLLPAGENASPQFDPQVLARGRMALAMGGVPERWPEYFLSGHGVPAELQQAIRKADLGRAPEIKFSNMVPRALVPASAGSRLRWQLSYRWPFLRIVTGLAVVLSLLGATLAAGR